MRNRSLAFKAKIGPIVGVLSLLACSLMVTGSASAITTTKVATGLSLPLYVTAAPGDFDRLFIVEQGGRIKILKNGAILPQPFLDISLPVACCGERGLLGLAFHPDYQNNGWFYVDYTQSGTGATIIARYQVTADPDVADPGSATTLLTIGQPAPNHNGGCIQFGPDGMLYVGMGDGGSGNDPWGNGQNTNSLLGAMLRLDVDAAAPYIPIDNPYVGKPDSLDEIWAIGVRNPWRFSFDRQNGDLWIGDVGQGAWEEIDYQPASSMGGENYGWRCMEGKHCTGLTGCTCNGPDLTLPIVEYNHPVGFSITGGYVYRGCAIPELDGMYFYADYSVARIWSFRYDGAVVSDSTERTLELDPPGADVISLISSFGEDNFGELYIVDYADGELYKIIPDDLGPDCNANGLKDSCEIVFGLAADADSNGIPDECALPCSCPNQGDVAPLITIGDGGVDVLDVVAAIDRVFRSGPALPTDAPDCPTGRADVSPAISGSQCGDTVVDVLDVVGMIDRVFRSGPPLCDPCNP